MLTSTPAVALALAALAWPVETLAKPHSVLVNSWPTALALGAHYGFHWGSDIAFTYGPLGFLRLPLPYFAGTTRLALLYVAITQLALSASLLYVLRRAFGLVPAAGLTLLALCLVPDERALAAAFVWAVVALRRDAPAIFRVAFAPGIGFLAALELLVKFNSGVAILVIGAIVSLAIGGARARGLLVLAGSFVASFTALWLLAGQRLGDVGSYLSGSREIVAGYTPALGGADQDTAGAVWVALLTIAVIFVIARHAVGRGAGGGLRWAIYPLWAAVAFLVFKEGFVRSDTSHRPIFFGFALCALLALAWDRRQRGRVLVASAAIALAVAWSFQASPLNATSPGSHLSAAISQLRIATRASDRRRSELRLRPQLRRYYGVDAGTLAGVRGRSVAIMPWEFAAAWAYRLRWRPLYTIEPSSTYTTALDDETARILRSARGPQRILRSTKITLDRRNTVWEMPAAMRTILCRYRQLSATDRWQVLARAPNRCGRATTIAIVHARWGQDVAVPRPAPGAAMFVRIRGVEPHGLESLETLLYRAQLRHIVRDRRSSRLVPGTASDGLVLWVPRAVDYSGRFAFSQQAHTLSVLWGDGGAQPSSDRITYQFEQLPIHPFDGGPA